ncbi:MAG: MDR family MFS transporter [Geodermatophilaceae bacterium]
MTTEAPETSTYLSHKQIILVMIGVMSGMLLAALDQSIVGTALPTITSELGGLDKLSWVVTAYLLTATAVTPLWGKISDLYGRRLIFQIAISIFLVGSALCGFSQNIEQLIAFRALQGIGGGGLFAIALSIIGDVIAPRDRGRYQGYFGAVFGVSSVAGPLLGGFFTDGPGWRWIFYINLPIGIAALFITSAVLTMPVVRRPHKIDYLGALTIVGAVSSLLLYLEWRGRDYGWTEGLALALISTFVVLTFAFVFIERRAVEPIIPMRLFRNATYRIGNIFGFCAGVAMFGAIIFLPLYLQAVQGYSATGSGLALIPVVVGILGSSIISGNLMSKTGRYKVFPILGSGADRRRPRAAVDAVGGHAVLAAGVVHAAVRNRARHDHADAGDGDPERRAARGHGGRDRFDDVLPPDGWCDRYGGVRCGAGHPAVALPGGGPRIGGTGRRRRRERRVRDQELTEPVKGIVLRAFGDAIGDVFLIGLPFLVLAFVVALFLKEKPLKTGHAPPASDDVGVAEAPVTTAAPRS